MSRNRNNYPFHNAPIGASDRSLLVAGMLKQARENARKRYWRSVRAIVILAVGTIALTVFAYYRIAP